MSNRSRRKFTPQFKAEVVLALLTGRQSQAELCRQHRLSPALLAQWREAFLANAGHAFASAEQRSEEAAKIAELERLVGRLTWENDALKKGTSILEQIRSGGGRS